MKIPNCGVQEGIRLEQEYVRVPGSMLDPTCQALPRCSSRSGCQLLALLRVVPHMWRIGSPLPVSAQLRVLRPK